MRYPHEERLRQFDAIAIGVKKVAVVKRLQAEELKREIALRLEGGGKPFHVIAAESGIEQFGRDAGLDIGWKIIGIAHRHVGLRSARRRGVHERQHFGTELVEQQPRAGIGVVRLLFHQRARRHHGRKRQFVLADAVIDVAVRFRKNRRGIDTIKSRAGFFNDQRQPGIVERNQRPVRQRDMDDGFG
jgi:hypothetical protein